jgi:CheY-like chemotaxis protein
VPDEILVLVAEDEELVRFLIAEVLRDEGIEVMEVGHAQAALDTLQQHAVRIHVLFTDIQMPGPMDGLALAHHTSKNWPWIGLLITSARPHRIEPYFRRKAGS